MKRVFVLLLMFFLLPVMADNVVELSKKADKYKGKYDYVFLIQKTYVKVKQSGASTVNEEKAVKVLSEKGAKKFYTVSMFFDPLTSEIKVLDAYILRKDGKKKSIDLKKVVQYPQPARWIYWPNTRVSIPFGLLNPGDIVVYKIQRQGFSYALLENKVKGSSSKFEPPMKGEFYDIVNFQGFVPILEKEYSIELPEKKNIQFKYFKGEVTPIAEFTDYGMKYTFKKSDIEPIKREPYMGEISDVCQKLLISTTHSWKDKSEWFYKINENFAFHVTPEIKKKVDEIIKGAKTDEEKIDRLNHWVAHYIRYSGLSMGKGEGYTLHPSEMTFRDRQGVCKDKAGMLITFLRAAGFDAYPAMTMAGARIEDFPADFFNHCVVALREKDGKFRMLDPTWVPWVREEWSSAEQEQQYLIGYKEGQSLRTTPYSPPEKHYYKLSSKARIDKKGKCVVSIKLEAEGQTDARLRRYMQGVEDNSGENYIKRIVFRSFPQAIIKKVKFQNPYDISKHMKIELVFEVPDFAFVKGDRYILKSPALSYLLNDFANYYLAHLDVSAKERKYPVHTRCTKLIKVDEEIYLPVKIDKDKSKIPEHFEYKGKFADASINFKAENNTIYQTMTVSLKKRVYPAKAWKDLKTVVGEVQKLGKGFIEVEGGK
ncbi:conserved hypothetical protein [Thermotomaculum hydrothermale]|uniref:Transglutaminase domain-containing protein n=1 Tax=Thermotomaculum hydrothermale TaxID=981385 RepID=A0A7R6PSS7_9BACT|nr:DUF3857 and transglutaminase domain-containing protein [Thermotomaculum hydrothermale]BBB31962.1 conserved hypothetical protein [Thermotomaculum hydrothermale]